MTSIPRNSEQARHIDAALEILPYRLDRLRGLKQAITPAEGLQALREANIFDFHSGDGFTHEIQFGELDAAKDPKVDLGKPHHTSDVGNPSGAIQTRRYSITFDDGTSHKDDRYEKNGIALVIDDVCTVGSRRHFYAATDSQIAALMQAVNATFGANGIYKAAIQLPLERGF